MPAVRPDPSARLEPRSSRSSPGVSEESAALVFEFPLGSSAVRRLHDPGPVRPPWRYASVHERVAHRRHRQDGPAQASASLDPSCPSARPPGANGHSPICGGISAADPPGLVVPPGGRGSRRSRQTTRPPGVSGANRASHSRASCPPTATRPLPAPGCRAGQRSRADAVGARRAPASGSESPAAPGAHALRAPVGTNLTTRGVVAERRASVGRLPTTNAARAPRARREHARQGGGGSRSSTQTDGPDAPGPSRRRQDVAAYPLRGARVRIGSDALTPMASFLRGREVALRADHRLAFDGRAIARR